MTKVLTTSFCHCSERNYVKSGIFFANSSLQFPPFLPSVIFSNSAWFTNSSRRYIRRCIVGKLYRCSSFPPVYFIVWRNKRWWLSPRTTDCR